MNGDYEFRKEIVGGQPFDTFQWIHSVVNAINKQVYWWNWVDRPQRQHQNNSFSSFNFRHKVISTKRQINRCLFWWNSLSGCAIAFIIRFGCFHMHQDQTIFRDCEIAFGKRFSLNIFIWCFNISFDRQLREFYRFAFPSNRNSGKSTWNWSRQTSSFMITNDLLPNRSVCDIYAILPLWNGTSARTLCWTLFLGDK